MGSCPIAQIWAIHQRQMVDMVCAVGSNHRGPWLGRQSHFLPLPHALCVNPGVSMGFVHQPNLASLGLFLQRANLLIRFTAADHIPLC